jgi:S1-C subfamily serine protease
VKKVATALIADGKYRHSWIGFIGVPVSLKIAEAMGLNTTQGILVVEVASDSPASRAGLKGGNKSITILGESVTVGGDVIVQVDEMKVKTFEDLSAYLEENTQPGDTIVLTILRENVKQRLTVTLGERQ